MEDNTFDLNDLPEEVLNEIAEGEVFEIEETITEESLLVEEVAEEAPTAEEVVKEPVVKEKPAPKKASAKKEPGMYHDGRLIEAVPSRLGKTWTVIIDGKREKILKSEIEIVE